MRKLGKAIAWLVRPAGGGPHVLCVTGTTLLGVGTWLVHPAVCLNGMGLLCIAFGVWVQRQHLRERARDR